MTRVVGSVSDNVYKGTQCLVTFIHIWQVCNKLESRDKVSPSLLFYGNGFKVHRVQECQKSASALPIKLSLFDFCEHHFQYDSQAILGVYRLNKWRLQHRLFFDRLLAFFQGAFAFALIGKYYRFLLRLLLH